MLLTFFFVGLYYAGWIDAGKGQGLAGGAIVLGYGVLFGGIAFIASFFIAFYSKLKLIIRFNWVLLLLLVIAYGITHYRYLQRKKPKEAQPNFKKTPTPKTKAEPTAMLNFTDTANYSNSEENDIGLGFFKPNFFEHPTLYFYGNITQGKTVLQHAPQDSLALGRDQFGDFKLISAPPYLWPEAMNQQFGIFYFKVITVGREFIEVEVNSKNGQTASMNKNQGTLLFWPEFLLTTNTISFVSGKEQTPKIKPLANASKVNISFANMKVIKVTQNWLKVDLQSKDNRTLATGWIQWSDNNQILINYTLPNIQPSP
ncbi:hypothetical protein DDV96_05540 [Marixanthomonas spongiae]|uniref:Uncharacterized protein n=2 Tax=Marixanthomonas spongiae TaxID=2174845 RepID=A0A2U0I3N3_9FLAO|nr:hypothetical protein DDV96_05540 [Marixanthomonas spongiae]